MAVARSEAVFIGKVNNPPRVEIPEDPFIQRIRALDLNHVYYSEDRPGKSSWIVKTRKNIAGEEETTIVYRRALAFMLDGQEHALTFDKVVKPELDADGRFSFESRDEYNIWALDPCLGPRNVSPRDPALQEGEEPHYGGNLHLGAAFHDIVRAKKRMGQTVTS